MRILDAELGTAPEQETTALYETIRTRQIDLPATAARQSSPLPMAMEPAPHERYVPEELLAAQRGQTQASGAGAPVVLRAPITHAEAETLLGSQIATLPEPIARQGALPQYREERRWVTILSADLPGFASLAERLDPEDLKALADQCVERLSAEVYRFGGTLINIMGNAMLAVFGAPVANEDDAERAVRAGLAIRDLALIGPGDPDERRIEARVGINTGDVMAGFVGPEERRDYTVIGGAVNIAARLMSGAPAKAVVVGEETYRATRGRVRYREVPPTSIGERDRPVAAWEALDAASMPWARPLRTPPLARRRPLCVLIEDIHWADEALLNLLEFVAARAQGVPLLIVTQARPELLERRPTWGGGLRAFMSLQLEPLDQDAGLALARALCHERGLPEAVIERVGRGAGGNPLFVEELIATIAERPDETGIPSAIKALIAARLDRLRSEERQIIARASVFGRHCWLGGLAALGLQVQGLALAGTGRYDEAWRVFDQASRFGREFGIGPFLARSITMSAGFHLDVFDFDGHTALAEEARDMARSVGFPPPLISASNVSQLSPPNSGAAP